MRGERTTMSRKVPEALGNRVCGVRPYVFVLVLDAAAHACFLFLYGPTVENFLRLFFSFIFFIYPLYYVADLLWSLRPSVSDILAGKIQINRKYYMNTVQRNFAWDELFPVTVSVAVYTESNEIIFQTLRQSLAAIRRYHAVSGKAANLVVSDDGLAPLLGGRCSKQELDLLLRKYEAGCKSLTEQEKQAAERIRFYRTYRIAFVARPAAGRAGLFKKASNLNYTMRLGNAIAAGAPTDTLLQKGQRFAHGYVEGDITTHEVILLLDKDSGVHERIIEAVLPEFASDERLAYVQCAGRAINLSENYYTYVTGHQVNNLFHNIWPCKALQGFFVPLVGHNVFLRKSILEKSGLWSEDKVSEDYDKAICLYSMGYHGKYAQLKGLEFTEYATGTFTEETCRQRRYAYGLFEMIFDGTIAPGRARGCDRFYMLLYFSSVINQAFLLPSVLAENYFGNIHLMWAGFLFCVFCFQLLPLFKGLLMRLRHRQLPREYVENLPYTLLTALSYIAHSFSFLAGACRYLMNKIKTNRKPFPATNVDRIRSGFAGGVKLLADYARKNPWILFMSFLCLDRGIFLLTDKGLEPLTKFTYCYILFCAVLVPVLLTPQLFGVRSTRKISVKCPEQEGVGEMMTIESAYLAAAEDLPASEGRDAVKGSGVPPGDIESFLADYQKTLQASLPDEHMPEALLDNYFIESCLRKDPQGKKELYVLRRKKDDKKALLRITKDYPQEDALEEAALLSELNHPGIPRVYDTYVKDGRKYLVREYVEGRSLQEAVTASGSPSAKDIFGIALKLADILSYLHAQVPPVIHRDIKPQNIIVGKDGGIHLIDFGIARVHKEESNRDTSIILTQDYASPEQYGFEQTTPLSDIYSLGMVFLFLATGGTARSGLQAQIVNNRLRMLIERCIAFNPKSRFQSVEEIRAYILQDSRLPTVKRRRRRAAVFVLPVVVAALVLLVHQVGRLTGQKSAEVNAYERGFDNGYTDGYQAVPAFSRSREEGLLQNGSFANMAVTEGAFAARGDGLIFYIDEAGDILSLSADGRQQKVLVEGARAAGLSFQNGWLYYTSGNRLLQTNIYTGESDELYSVSTESLEQSGVGKLYVADDRFYIRNTVGCYRLDVNTGEAVPLTALVNCESLCTDTENLYFINTGDRALYSCDVAGNNSVKAGEGLYESICLFGDNLYCAIQAGATGKLIRLHPESGETQSLLEVDAASVNVAETAIYFLDLSDERIYRCSFDGRIRETVSTNQVEDFNIAGDRIFYHNKGDDGRLWCVRIDGSDDHPVR